MNASKTSKGWKSNDFLEQTNVIQHVLDCPRVGFSWRETGDGHSYPLEKRHVTMQQNMKNASFWIHYSIHYSNSPPWMSCSIFGRANNPIRIKKCATLWSSTNSCKGDMGVNPKIMVPPNHPFVHRVVPLFSPSILGVSPYFWFNTNISDENLLCLFVDSWKWQNSLIWSLSCLAISVDIFVGKKTPGHNFQGARIHFKSGLTCCIIHKSVLENVPFHIGCAFKLRYQVPNNPSDWSISTSILFSHCQFFQSRNKIPGNPIGQILHKNGVYLTINTWPLENWMDFYYLLFDHHGVGGRYIYVKSW